jgi:hypothetical protein
MENLESLKTELIETATIIKNILNTDHTTSSEEALFSDYRLFSISLKKIRRLRDSLVDWERISDFKTIIEIENFVRKYYEPTRDDNANQLRTNFTLLCYRVNSKTLRAIDNEVDTKFSKPITF